MQTTGQTGVAAPAPAAAQRPTKPAIPPEFQAASINRMDQAKLIQILKDSGSTVFQKAKACQRLAQVGAKEAVPALAALLADQQLAHYARYGLEPIPDPSVDDALRDALKKVKGSLLVGVINSIGQRRDAGAVEPLVKLMYESDAGAALAAAAALGRISGPQASRALQEALGRTKGALRAAVAGAGLVCAEGLLARGDRQQAVTLRQVLSRPDMPKAVRLGAMHSIIADETSLKRPRI